MLIKNFLDNNCTVGIGEAFCERDDILNLGV